jgi:hypothetical protein
MPVNLDSWWGSHMFGHFGYSTACIPGQEILICQLRCGQLLLANLLSLKGSREQWGVLDLWCTSRLLDYFFKLCHLLWNSLFGSVFWWLSQSEVLYWPVPLLQAALRTTVPFLYAAGISLHQTLLGEKDFLIPKNYVAGKVLHVLMLNHGWLALFLLELIEGELQTYQQFSEVELAHLPVLVSPLSEAQWNCVARL